MAARVARARVFSARVCAVCFGLWGFLGLEPQGLGCGFF